MPVTSRILWNILRLENPTTNYKPSFATVILGGGKIEDIVFARMTLEQFFLLEML